MCTDEGVVSVAFRDVIVICGVFTLTFAVAGTEGGDQRHARASHHDVSAEIAGGGTAQECSS